MYRTQNESWREEDALMSYNHYDSIEMTPCREKDLLEARYGKRIVVRRSTRVAPLQKTELSLFVRAIPLHCIFLFVFVFAREQTFTLPPPILQDGSSST